MGPLLFCLYINDIKSHLPTGVFHLFYANDLQVYLQVFPEDTSDTINKLILVARKISDWTDSVSFHLNHKKTKAIYFDRSTFENGLHGANLSGINIGGGVVIQFSEEVKSLGVILGCRLS